MQNLLHTPIGNYFPDIINSIVEIPKDTNAKYEYDIKLGLLKLDRFLISSMRYPASYGFVPQTICPDEDPLDILIYSSVPIQSLTLVEVKPIGALHMIDAGVDDYKVIGIPIYNPNDYNELKDLDPIFLEVVSDFFRNYKNNDPKKKGTAIVKEWVNAENTEKIIRDSHQKYKDVYQQVDRQLIYS